MEKAQALGAASQSFAQLRTASHSFAELRRASQSFWCSRVVRCLQPKLLWLCEGLSDPHPSPLPPCGYACVRMRAYAHACVRMCARVCVRESSSEAWRSLSEAWRSLSEAWRSLSEAWRSLSDTFRASAKSRVISALGMPPKRVRTAYKPFFGLWVGCPTCSHRKRLKTALIAS